MMSRKIAILLVISGAVFMSTTGIFMRMLEHAGPFQVLLYRAIGLCGMLALLICIRRRISFLALLQSLDWQDLQIGFCLSMAFTGFVFSISYTSVASTLFILTVAPLLAASIAWIWIGEKPHPFTWFAMAASSGGVILMIEDGISTGRTFGNLCALVAAGMFAVMLVLARKNRKTDILGGTFIGGVLSSIYGLICSIAFAGTVHVEMYDLVLILIMGAFATGLGIGLVTWATPFIPAAEVSVLVLVESALGPVWVWMLGFEGITRMEFLGGAIVFVSVIALSFVTAKSSVLHESLRAAPDSRLD